ncbi:MAG: L-serine ammonia-lyase, iron-sulfur-dependent, subunit alpha [Candidatus Heimdallarchaeaceae archaeon]
MFESIKQLITECEEKQQDIVEIIIQEEINTTEKTREEIITRSKELVEIMRRSLSKGITEDVTLPIEEAMEQSQKLISNPIFLSKDLKEAIYWSMSIGEYNSGMGLIVACPTAGSAGVFPSVLFKAKEMLSKEDDEIIKAFILGGAIGAIIGNKATLSGSEGGCQAEIGVASAMSAAAITYLAGGNNEQIGHAIAIALINLMGLICDPVAGLVITPCIKRNAMGVMNAFLASEMAMSGLTSVIPVDEVIEALNSVCRKLPFELKETGLGGIANTPTAKRIKKRLYGTDE